MSNNNQPSQEKPSHSETKEAEETEEKPAEAEEQKSLLPEEISRLREEVLRAIGRIKRGPKKGVSKRVVFGGRRGKRVKVQKPKLVFGRLMSFPLWKWGIFLFILILLLVTIAWTL